MDLNNRYWKLVKNYILMTIVFSLVGFVYGAIFNFILSGDDATVFWSCVHGVLVGFLAGIMYMFLTFSFGHCFNQEYVTIKLEKTITILINTIAFVGMCYAITMIISNNELITFHYAWMHIVNLLFVSVVVGKANYDGKALRNFIKESEKNKHLTEPTDEVV